MFNQGKMNKMLKQAKAMQDNMAKVQNELEDVIIEESAGDLITIKMNAKLDLLDVSLSDVALNEDKDILEDVILATVNKAITKAQDEAQSRMNAVTGNMLGGLNLPGM
jgi:DNA-binding YbaB/EbfC family protein